MPKKSNSAKTLFWGFAVAYVAGMLVVALIWGIVQINRVKRASTSQAGFSQMYDRESVDKTDLLILSNGGFEEPAIAGASQFVSNAQNLGWQVAWTNPSTLPPIKGKISTSGIRTVEPLAELRKGGASEGGQYVELDTYELADQIGRQSLITLSQSSPVVANADYVLSFDMATGEKTGADDVCMNVRFAGRDIAKIRGFSDKYLQWRSFAYTVNSATDTALLEFVGCGKENGFGAALDNVKLVPN